MNGTAQAALERAHARDLAAAAGRRLIAQAMPAEGGLKWAMTPAKPTRLYPNFSHGTAGIAYFLATLHQETKDRAFLDPALAGARYLLKVARTEGDQCLVFHHEPEADGLDHRLSPAVQAATADVTPGRRRPGPPAPPSARPAGGCTSR